MTIQPYHRYSAIDNFEIVRRRARREAFLATLLKRENQLVNFSELKPLLPWQKRYRGIKEILLEAIVGSINRTSDFNRNFHPLTDALKQRWIQIYILAQTSGWLPIQVYQMGNLYFVDDGHHRVSVAKYLKLSHIEAEVWEYPLDLTFDPRCSVQTIRSQLKMQLCFNPAVTTTKIDTGNCYPTL